MSHDHEDPTIDSLIGHGSRKEIPSGKGDDFVQEILGRLTPEQKALAREEATRDRLGELPGILVLGSDSDSYSLQGLLGTRATLVPENRHLSPFSDQMNSYSGVIVTEQYITEESDLLRRSLGIPVAIVKPGFAPGVEGLVWRLTRPLESVENEIVFAQLVRGHHPNTRNGLHEQFGNTETASEFARKLFDNPEEYREVTQAAFEPLKEMHDTSGTAAEPPGSNDINADPLGLVRTLLDSRHTGESIASAIKRWVESETSLFGWVELTPNGDNPPLVQVGGHRPGEVYRRLGDVLDTHTPLPSSKGDYGPFIGLPVADHWLGVLPGESAESRRSFWRVLEILPQVENLIPRSHPDGSPRVEDPADRFERLLNSRIRSAERHGTLPGVLLLEIPESEKNPLSRLRMEIRESDWCEVEGNRIWILLDQPEPGTAVGLTSRILEALPGVRGGGTIGACTGYIARQCMDRVIDMLRSNDTLRIEEEDR